MPTTLERKADERAEWLSRRIGQEIRSTRKACGWSQRELAARAGVDQSAVSRVERGWTCASIALLSRLTVELALDFSARVYPADDLVLRDERQLRQVGLIVARKGAAWHASLEARVGVDSRDHRAIDIVLATALEVWAVEVERDLSNFQEQLRGDLLKRDLLAQRESRPVRFILALPDTRRLRALVRAHEPLIRETLPASSRQIWACLRTGTPLGADGLLWLPPNPVAAVAPGKAAAAGAVATPAARVPAESNAGERGALVHLMHQEPQNNPIAAEVVQSRPI
jgi:transcriptional regulator with XRE-family HTH domain